MTFGEDRLKLDRPTLDARPGLVNYAGKEIVVGYVRKVSRSIGR